MFGALLALHGAGGLDGPTVEQEFFGQCSFTGVGVRDDRKRARDSISSRNDAIGAYSSTISIVVYHTQF